MEIWDRLKIYSQWCTALSAASMLCPVRKLFLTLAQWFWARDTHGKRVQAAEVGMFYALVGLGWPVCAMRLNSLSLHRYRHRKNKIPGEQELNQLIFSIKACFWHVSLYYVTQHCCSKIQIGFYSVFPAGNLQMLGIQLRLCKDHIAFETKILWSRCCCRQDASAYPAKGSFPSLFLRAFSENRGYGSVKPMLGCSTPVPFTCKGSWSTACWSRWNGNRFY